MSYTNAEIFLAASNMEAFGGSFASYIGSALLQADSDNLQRLVAAFPELIERYLNFEL